MTALSKYILQKHKIMIFQNTSSLSLPYHSYHHISPQHFFNIQSTLSTFPPKYKRIIFIANCNKNSVNCEGVEVILPTTPENSRGNFTVIYKHLTAIEVLLPTLS